MREVTHYFIYRIIEARMHETTTMQCLGQVIALDDIFQKTITSVSKLNQPADGIELLVLAYTDDL